MLQAHAKTFVEYVASFWSSVGRLMGVIIGGLLTRSWDRQKWMNDNRKLEFKELIEALTEAATALMKEQPVRSGSPQKLYEDPDARAKHLQALKVIETRVYRVYTARDVKEMGLFYNWTQGIQKMIERDEIKRFEMVYEDIRDEIVERATFMPTIFVPDFKAYVRKLRKKKGRY